MASYPSPSQRRPSLSPNSFLSPSRKRSFNAIDLEPSPPILESSKPGSSPNSQPKRLSSIKSILNPGFSDPEANDADSALRSNPERLSPNLYAATSPSLSSYTTSPAGSATGNSRDTKRDNERSKNERREMLEREADHMREALKAKEKELADLGMGE